MKGIHLSLTIGLLASLVAPLTLAQGQSQPAQGRDTQAQTQGKSSNEKANVDEKFVKQAAIGSMAEIELADLANQKAQSSAVKDFATQLKQDHQQASQKLQSIATQKGIELPKALDNSHKRTRDRLAKMEGAEFDREYMNLMVKEHKQDLKDFEKQAKDAKDAELKNFAAQTAPQLREHLQHAEQLQSQLTDSGRQGQSQGDMKNTKGNKSPS